MPAHFMRVRRSSVPVLYISTLRRVSRAFTSHTRQSHRTPLPPGWTLAPTSRMFGLRCGRTLSTSGLRAQPSSGLGIASTRRWTESVTTPESSPFRFRRPHLSNSVIRRVGGRAIPTYVPASWGKLNSAFGRFYSRNIASFLQAHLR